MKFSHVFITRPRKDAEELAAMLTPLGLHSIIQPAFSYFPVQARASQEEVFNELDMAGPESLVIFSSPRAVAHGLAQLPVEALFRARVAAIGPATAKALAAAGIRVGITPGKGYTSEALLEALAEDPLRGSAGRSLAFIVAAPGGRKKLYEGLQALGWKSRMVMVYRPEAAELDKPALAALKDASAVICVWTSANAMKALSQRLPPATWFQLCQADWLVISQRLKRLARAYGPVRVHMASGPGNSDLFSAIRGLC